MVKQCVCRLYTAGIRKNGLKQDRILSFLRNNFLRKKQIGSNIKATEK